MLSAILLIAMSEIVKVLGNNIRRLRKSQNLTQEQLAEKADISVPYMTQIELGQKQPTLETVEAIANALKIPFDGLFRTEPTTNENINSSLKTFESNLIKSLTTSIHHQFSNLRI